MLVLAGLTVKKLVLLLLQNFGVERTNLLAAPCIYQLHTSDALIKSLFVFAIFQLVRLLHFFKQGGFFLSLVDTKRRG